MPLILCECALHRFRQIPPIWTSLMKVTFKFTSNPKQWLVCTTFSANILLRVLIHSLKSYFLIFLHVFILIFSIISPTNTPRMMNQSFQSTLQFLHFIRTVQPTFLNSFISSFFSCNSKTFTTRTTPDIQKGRRSRTTDDPQEGP